MSTTTTLRHPSQPFTRNVIFIVGNGTIGKAVSQFYLAKGWQVCIVSRNVSNQHKDNLMTISANAKNISELNQAVQQCVKSFGGISIALCSAGEPIKQAVLSSSSPIVSEVAPSLCTIELNFSRTVAPILRKQKEGSMVFLNSNLVQQCLDLPGLSEFLLWGNAVSGLADGLCTELRSAGVRVSCLFLGMIRDSPFSLQLRRIFSKGMNPSLTNEVSVPALDVAKSVDFVAQGLNGSVWELRLTPQLMFDRNQLFTDRKRVEEKMATLPKVAESTDRPVALVTGAGKGIGKGVALEMVKAGFDLIAIARTKADLDLLQQECKLLGADVFVLALDITDQVKLEQGLNLAMKHFKGRLHVVVSNAGTNRRRVAALADMKTWTDVMDVDLLAAMNLTRLTIPHLLMQNNKQERKPFVVFVSTRYAHPKGVRMPGITPYITAKAGTNAFSDTILEEVRDFGIGVLCLSPGTVATDLGLKPNQVNKDGGSLIPPEYLLQPSDCGKAIVFATQSLSANSCMSSIWLETLYHGYPAIRKSQQTYLDAHL